MAFSVLVEMLNLRLHRRTTPVRLHQPYIDEAAGATGGEEKQ
jgi:hypothetical protein